ncbi:iron chelate uptake ABC transporter family permease subunit, partial [Burkholderia sp. Ac-20384]
MSVHVRASRPGMRVVLPALTLLLIVSIVASAAFGPAPIAMPAAVRIVATHIVSAFGDAGAFAAGAGDDSIVWLIRMPRALLAAIVGATLAAVGVALQA